jgi:hypothetical protein
MVEIKVDIMLLVVVVELALRVLLVQELPLLKFQVLEVWD